MPARKTRVKGPISISSPGSSTTGDAIRVPRTAVPFLLDKSSIATCMPATVSLA